MYGLHTISTDWHIKTDDLHTTGVPTYMDTECSVNTIKSRTRVLEGPTQVPNPLTGAPLHQPACHWNAI